VVDPVCTQLVHGTSKFGGNPGGNAGGNAGGNEGGKVGPKDGGNEGGGAEVVKLTVEEKSELTPYVVSSLTFTV